MRQRAATGSSPSYSCPPLNASPIRGVRNRPWPPLRPPTVRPSARTLLKRREEGRLVRRAPRQSPSSLYAPRRVASPAGRRRTSNVSTPSRLDVSARPPALSADGIRFVSGHIETCRNIAAGSPGGSPCGVLLLLVCVNLLHGPRNACHGCKVGSADPNALFGGVHDCTPPGAAMDNTC
jgi:hypothetical protein